MTSECTVNVIHLIYFGMLEASVCLFDQYVIAQIEFLASATSIVYLIGSPVSACKGSKVISASWQQLQILPGEVLRRDPAGNVPAQRP